MCEFSRSSLRERCLQSNRPCGLMLSKTSIRSLDDLFAENLNNLKRVIPDGDRDHALCVEGAWRDVITFSEVYEALISELEQLAIDPYASVSAMSESELEGFRRGRQIENRLDSFLRATVVFGDVVNLRLLQVVFRMYDTDLNVTRLSDNRSSPAARDWIEDLGTPLTRAHALRIYRNQLVMHFNKFRTLGATWMTGDHRSRRLLPLNLEAPVDEIHPTLEEIAGRNANIPEVASLNTVAPGVHNFYELLQALFDNLPPLRGVERNPDRRAVDKTASVGGVKSPTMFEVLETAVVFGRALVKQIEQKGPPPLISPVD